MNYLAFLQKEIHSAAFATIAADGRPQVRIIDIMLCDESSLYFLTAKGKEFYRQLTEQQFVAVTGVKDQKAVSLRGKVRIADPALLDEMFEQNPYMKEIYPGNTRKALEAFQIYEGEGEFFDLTCKPVFREAFTLSGSTAYALSYHIIDACTGCGSCLAVCPQSCISSASVPYRIAAEHCLHCGACRKVCPSGAVRFD
ncbi:pyridoxamine 5'-phosphate oxidase family protein [Christensenella tenuis]|jgi:uncharacterized pyridoxamine 5'-phosphate oxidase family protein/NAD-dependent dihydropyrimidine dehydrogenase PreA subunit|uniref:Ferredoxin n=1 Tax=Christensenella tenuis TaxID=2763033 RepID=A0ABR7EIJ0_9FIRM|nr:4Fe-4S binding protein [Christensenella tenuis]MBC5648949.1 4Fe-4S binding protein [Christensenella tenuis]